MEAGTDAEVASNSDNESANSNLCLSEQLPLTANPGNSDAEASSPAIEPLRTGSASSVELVTVTPNSVDSSANFEKIMVAPQVCLLQQYFPVLFIRCACCNSISPFFDCVSVMSGDLYLWYRHISKGAWPFSTADQGWPVSDTTAEGLKAVLLLSHLPSELVGEPIEAKRLYDAVNVILSLQNDGGGFATFELTRSYSWMEIVDFEGLQGGKEGSRERKR